MNRPFYEIDKSAYLFYQNNKPEEKVRQWVIYELLSSYGININNIKVEEKAKVGSKWYRADVVVYKNHVPYIVIECKKQEDENINEGIKQAISYANFFKAKFVVFTNGNIWRVKREIKGEWVDFPDIEKQIDERDLDSIEELIWNIEGLKPILYWLHRPVSPVCAQDFLSFLQKLFHLRRYLFKSIQSDLVEGTELLLRAMTSSPFDSIKESSVYVEEKLYNSFISYQIYFDYRGLGKISLGKPEIYNIEEKIRLFYIAFNKLHIKSLNKSFEEISFIRLTLSLLIYFQQIRHKQTYIEISEGIVSELYYLIEPICRKKFNVRLPDRLENLEDLQDSCKSEWQTKRQLTRR